jgi:hypothetical protein
MHLEFRPSKARKRGAGISFLERINLIGRAMLRWMNNNYNLHSGSKVNWEEIWYRKATSMLETSLIFTNLVSRRRGNNIHRGLFYTEVRFLIALFNDAVD